MKSLRRNSLPENVLVTLGQMRVATRKMLGAVMYYYDESNDMTIRYSDRSVALSRALARVKAMGYIEEVEEENTRYLYLSQTGVEYLQKIGVNLPKTIEEKSPKNTKDRKQLVAHATALYVGRSMRVYSLPDEKPSFEELATMMRATSFPLPRQHEECVFSRQAVETDLLPYGICYSRSEIRNAYNNSYNDAMQHTTTRRLGMIFKNDSVTTLFPLNQKNDVFWPGPERIFTQTVMQDLGEMYIKLVDVRKVAYVLADSFLSLPSFFHGCIDGVEKSGKPVCQRVGRSEMSCFEVDKMREYDEVYLMPKRTNFAQYREDLDAYTQEMEEEDYENFRDTHPEVEGIVVIAQYPNLMKLREHFVARDAVTLVGNGDPLIVDMLSRCMRTCLNAYYDIKTGKPVPFTRYSNTGRPLIGNTNQIDHKKGAAINAREFMGKSAFL